MENKVLTGAIITEKVYTLELSEDDVKSIIQERFQHLGEKLEIDINCRQDFLDSISVTIREKTVEQKEIKLSELPK